MGKIRVLPDQVANQIAAGEVVERPASVLKELVENALDAGASRLEIAWEEGGKRLLSVADNGCGMARDDLYLALERHATSKIASAQDLEKLDSYGFRGEALPSIASVSRLELHSAERDGEGHRLICEYGQFRPAQPLPRAQGTTLTVQDLFAQLPARRRFLKSSETEHAQLWASLTRLILAAPSVHWTLRPDRGSPLILPPVREEGERLEALLGSRLGALRAFRAERGALQLHGWISPPDLSFRDRSHLYLFVNGRAVRDRLLLGALAQAWEGSFAKGAYPAVVLFLELPPDRVDVNVHPTKAEVRFREGSAIFASVTSALREAWGEMKELPSILDLPPRPQEPEFDRIQRPQATTPRLWEPAQPDPRPQPEGLDPAFAYHLGQRPQEALISGDCGSRVGSKLGPGPLGPTPLHGFRSAKGLAAIAPSGLDRPFPALRREAGAAEDPPDFRLVGSFLNTYLIVEAQGEREPELWILDQHAAHERVLFERLNRREHQGALQPLLPPQVLGIGPQALARMEPFLEEFRRLGLEMEPLGQDALVLRALPDFLAEENLQSLLEELLRLLENQGRADLEGFRHKLNAHLACRAAIKKHESLREPQLVALIRDLLACEQPHTCPHGRPILKKLSLSELERSFGRKS